MSASNSTCWTMIRDAASADHGARAAFADRYAPVIRAYLAARWRSSPLATSVGDAVQDMFVECFRPGGLLARVDASAASGFRAFLYGATRHIALRHEARRASDARFTNDAVSLAAVPAEADSFSVVFDRAWAQAIMREAGERQERLARERGEAAVRRLQILRLRFQDGLPIRAIADKLQVDAAKLHHEYARAREEFREALLEVLSFYHPGAPEVVQKEAAELVTLLE